MDEAVDQGNDSPTKVITNLVSVILRGPVAKRKLALCIRKHQQAITRPPVPLIPSPDSVLCTPAGQCCLSIGQHKCQSIVFQYML